MPTPQKIVTCLFFAHEAEQAARFYASLFPQSRIDTVRRYGPNAPMPEGTVMLVEFTLGGVPFQAINGGQGFKPSEAMSLSVGCVDQAEIDRLWAALSSDGGQELACGWVKDRWGFAWQILPATLPELLSGDAASGERVLQALWAMRKIDIAALEAARHARG